MGRREPATAGWRRIARAAASASVEAAWTELFLSPLHAGLCGRSRRADLLGADYGGRASSGSRRRDHPRSRSELGFAALLREAGRFAGSAAEVESIVRGMRRKIEALLQRRGATRPRCDPAEGGRFRRAVVRPRRPSASSRPTASS